LVILSTIPPRTSGDVTPYNDAIKTLAQTAKLPLIDYYAEILARQPGVAWQTTLISGDGVHPTGAAPAADPYASGGDPAAHRTGANAANDGYLLRGWLTMQKLKEVKSYVADGVNPPGWVAPGGGAPGGSPDDGGGCGGQVAGPGAVPFWIALAFAGLALVRRR
jgi:hypothetical protein